MDCNKTQNDFLAVVGMACRFPGAASLEEFWENLLAGRQAMSPVSEQALNAGPHKNVWRLPGYVRMCCRLEDVEFFDPDFFGLSTAEAEIMDPQHRLLLETAWRALENSGDTRPDAEKTRTGVYASVNISSYMLGNLYSHMLTGTLDPFEVLLGNDKDYLATRIAYRLGLRGPAVSVQTACSSSMAALHMACQALVSGECDRALAGAATIPLPAELGYMYIPGGMRSPDGRCRPYDANAAGTIFGSGVAAVVLKRLEDAVEAGDGIWAVIRGSAINNDGREKVSFTAPNLAAQAAVIQEAMLMAGVCPSDMAFVEGHGTATPLGDPIEVAALRAAYAGHEKKSAVYLGSVKGNVGHLDATSGLAGFIKAALSLHHGVFPGTANFTRINPRFGDGIAPFEVNAEPRPLDDDPQNRIGGVSSFGFGGTNVHMILQGARQKTSTPVSSPPEPQPLFLSADTEREMERLEQALSTCLQREEPSPPPLRDLAFTLATGRRHGRLRRIVTGQAPQDVLAALGNHDRFPVKSADGKKEICFLFPGQGSQSPHMLRSLYRQNPRFRELLAENRRHILAAGGPDILNLLRESWDDEPGSFERITRTDMMQPVLFALELSLATLLEEAGVRPACLLGHSLGEIAAACFAGVFTPVDAARLVTKRGALMQQAPEGRMLAALLPREKLSLALGPLLDRMETVVVNSRSNCVLSGPENILEQAREALECAGGAGIFLRTSHAFHSSAMDGILEVFETVAASIPMNAPSIPVISNVTGRWAGDEMASPQYWVRHIRSCVRFDACLETAFATPRMALEVGPGSVLSSLLRQHVGPDIIAFSPFAEDGGHQVPASIAEGLWLNGADIDWRGIRADARRCPLPRLPMRKRRIWISPEETPAVHPPAEPVEHAGISQPQGGESRAGARRMEDVIASIWEKILRMHPMDRDTSFIELGGNSVHVLHMIRLAQEEGITFSMKDVFETKTVNALCRRIDETGKIPSAPSSPGTHASTDDIDSRDMAVLRRVFDAGQA